MGASYPGTHNITSRSPSSQEAGLEMERARFRLALIWDVGVTGGGPTCYTRMRLSLSLFYIVQESVITDPKHQPYLFLEVKTDLDSIADFLKFLKHSNTHCSKFLGCSAKFQSDSLSLPASSEELLLSSATSATL